MNEQVFWKLEGKKLMQCSLDEWGRFFHSEEKIVAKTYVSGFEVSTIFLGIDHGWGDGLLHFFETMVFNIGSNTDLDLDRYSTYDQAETGHIEMVKRVFRGEFNDRKNTD